MSFRYEGNILKKYGPEYSLPCLATSNVNKMAVVKTLMSIKVIQEFSRFLITDVTSTSTRVTNVYRI